MDEAPRLPTCEKLAVSGVEFPYSSIGGGEVVLFVHGAWADHRIWQPVSHRVAERHHFLAYTQRHFGPWPWPTEKPHSRDVHAADLVEFITALGTPVHLVGWSYAGAVLLGAARDLPRLVRSLVLFDPSLPELLSDSDEGRAAADDFWRGLAPAYDTARRGDLDAGMREGLEFVFGLPNGGFADLDEPARRVFLDNTRTMFPDLEAPTPIPWTPAQLTAIDQPVLVVSGEHTHPTYRIEAAVLGRAIPEIEFATMDGVGHGGPVQNPARFAELSLGFIDRLPRS